MVKQLELNLNFETVQNKKFTYRSRLPVHFRTNLLYQQRFLISLMPDVAKQNIEHFSFLGDCHRNLVVTIYGRIKLSIQEREVNIQI